MHDCLQSNELASSQCTMLIAACIYSFHLLLATSNFVKASSNLTLRHQHSDPESVIQDFQWKLDQSISKRRAMLSTNEQADSPICFTGNPIDDCWRCDPNWAADRQRLAECGLGFGQKAMGGLGGQMYVVTVPSDRDAVNPKPGTLRYGVIQTEPLWIVFSGDMIIKLSQELIVNSFKTIDGRGANVHIAGGACITIQYVTNVIIHNVHIHHCVPRGNTNVRDSPTHYGWRTKSDGDGVSIFGASNIWIDHCSLARCADGLIDVVMGSTAITISNNYFTHHDEVMLLGHSDEYTPDNGMQVTIAFNHFGEGLVQRMPRCRKGYFHVVNNDYTRWEMYAIGGSGNPTINSQGNRYSAPADRNAKEVTKRVDTGENEWKRWDWRSEGDLMVNGAFFVPSGEGLAFRYDEASSLEAKSAVLIDQLTMNAGVMIPTRDMGGRGYGFNQGTGSDGEGTMIGMGPGNIGDGEYYLGTVLKSGTDRTTSTCFSCLAALQILSSLIHLMYVHEDNFMGIEIFRNYF